MLLMWEIEERGCVCVCGLDMAYIKIDKMGCLEGCVKIVLRKTVLMLVGDDDDDMIVGLVTAFTLLAISLGDPFIKLLLGGFVTMGVDETGCEICGKTSLDVGFWCGCKNGFEPDQVL